ncbi:MAG: hypothetical protein KY462_02275 [Actinobacteria bacterium]|nr:hypothetical protein [Actinomycetota bacterium]
MNEPTDVAEGQTAADVRVRYEIVFDARDRSVGERLRGQLQEVISGWASGTEQPVEVGESDEGPGSWGVAVTFPDAAAADGFFRGEDYRQFCVEVRRNTQSSVLVVPSGPIEEDG